jgi:hypothetical protein
MDEVKRKKMRRKEKGKGGGGRIKSTPSPFESWIRH